MRRLPFVVFALCLCLLAAFEGRSAGEEASASPGVAAPEAVAAPKADAPQAPGSSGAAAPQNSGSPGVAASEAATAPEAAAAPKADTPQTSGSPGVAAPQAPSSPGVAAPEAVAAPEKIFTGAPLPNTPPPGWTEEQLADLCRLELHLRHEDTHPPSPPTRSKMYYNITLAAQDVNISGKERLLCVRRVWVKTDLGSVGIGCQPDECLGYEFFSFRTAILAVPNELHIQSAVMDVAPYREAPESAVLRNLDALPALRAVPLPPVVLTMAGRPLPKPPAEIPAPSEKNPWPSKYRIHLAAAFTDTRAPHWRCYSYKIEQLPPDANSFSGIHIRTSLGDYKVMERLAGGYAIFCAPKGAERIDIQHSTFWKGSDMRKLQRMNGGPLLVDDGFTPLPFVTDRGPLPPPADGMYPLVEVFQRDRPQ